MVSAKPTRQVHSVVNATQAFVDELEPILDRCASDGRIVRRQDFYEEFPYYLNIRHNRRKSLPTRQEVLAMADFLNCTIRERNKLLAAAGYAPDDEEPDGDDLNRALDTAQGIVDYLPHPAYVVTRDDVIHGWNFHAQVLFFKSSDELQRTPAHLRNVLRFIFDSRSTVHHLLTRDRSEYTWWRYTAILNIYRFKRDNINATQEPWYENRVAMLLSFPGFADMWANVHVETGLEMLSQYRCSLPAGYVTKMYSPYGDLMTVRGIQMRAVDTDWPQIVAYMPADSESERVFTRLGIPNPTNSWTMQRTVAK